MVRELLQASAAQRASLGLPSELGDRLLVPRDRPDRRRAQNLVVRSASRSAPRAGRRRSVAAPRGRASASAIDAGGTGLPSPRPARSSAARSVARARSSSSSVADPLGRRLPRGEAARPVAELRHEPRPPREAVFLGLREGTFDTGPGPLELTRERMPRFLLLRAARVEIAASGANLQRADPFDHDPRRRIERPGALFPLGDALAVDHEIARGAQSHRGRGRRERRAHLCEPFARATQALDLGLVDPRLGELRPELDYARLLLSGAREPLHHFVLAPGRLVEVGAPAGAKVLRVRRFEGDVRLFGALRSPASSRARELPLRRRSARRSARPLVREPSIDLRGALGELFALGERPLSELRLRPPPGHVGLERLELRREILRPRDPRRRLGDARPLRRAIRVERFELALDRRQLVGGAVRLGPLRRRLRERRSPPSPWRGRARQRAPPSPSRSS